ncbi:MAG: DUF3109 family protein [Bacteroidota bacterium]
MRRRKKKKVFPGIIEIEDTLISSEVVEELFACDIVRCKGACCVEGDLGAPLEQEELSIMDEIYETVEPYMRAEGKKVVKQSGTYVKDFTGNYSTPLVDGKECVYVTFKNGIASCAIEQAHLDGKLDFQKPISCHLYPIRVSSYQGTDRLNYDRWDICSAACNRGEAEGIAVYEFVKSALIRKYGEKFYEVLDEIAKNISKEEA